MVAAAFETFTSQYAVTGYTSGLGDHNAMTNASIGLSDNTGLATNLVEWAAVAPEPAMSSACTECGHGILEFDEECDLGVANADNAGRRPTGSTSEGSASGGSTSGGSTSGGSATGSAESDGGGSSGGAADAGSTSGGTGTSGEATDGPATGDSATGSDPPDSTQGNAEGSSAGSPEAGDGTQSGDGSPATSDSGCACRSQGRPPGWQWAGLLGLLGLRRRRRQ